MQTFLLLSKSQTPPGQTEITLVTRKFTLRLFLLTSINITTPSVKKKKKKPQSWHYFRKGDKNKN